MPNPTPFRPAMWIFLIVVGAALAGGVGVAIGYFVNPRTSHPVVAGGAEVDPSARGFARVFEKELGDPRWDGVAVSMVVLDEEGKTWFASPLARTVMCPASALKVLTTGAALGMLGPDFRFETTFASEARLLPTLDGDLVIVGGGDPTLSSARLEAMVGELCDRGLRRIDGQVRVDGSIFPEHPMSDHWNWGDIGNAYGAGAYGLNVDHNRMILRFQGAGEAGDDVVFLGSSHEVPNVEWVHRLKILPRAMTGWHSAYSEPYGNRVTTRGGFSAGQEAFHIRAAIPDPPGTARSVVISAMRQRGVDITGRRHPATVPAQLLVKSESAPLLEIIRSIHQTSDNLEAQCLFLILGRTEDPARVVRDYWESRGVSFVALRMLDGSGLARANMIRAIDLAQVMRAAVAGPHGGKFLASLPDVQDGAVRSKPGWMSGVTTSVGIITTESGRRLPYAFMANGVPNSHEAKQLRDRLRAAVAPGR